MSAAPWQEGQHLGAAKFPNLKAALECWHMASLRLAAAWPQGGPGGLQSERAWERLGAGEGWAPDSSLLESFLSLLLHPDPPPRVTAVTWASWLGDSPRTSLGLRLPWSRMQLCSLWGPRAGRGPGQRGWISALSGGRPHECRVYVRLPGGLDWTSQA